MNNHQQRHETELDRAIRRAPFTSDVVHDHNPGMELWVAQDDGPWEQVPMPLSPGDVEPTVFQNFMEGIGILCLVGLVILVGVLWMQR